MSSEFAYLTRCCKWPSRPADHAALRQGAAQLDWALLERMARRHRVEGLVAHALAASSVAVPAEVSARLAAAAERIGIENLRGVGEAARIHAHLAALGIAHLFVKGTTLGALAYGTVLLKSGWDIDLLVGADALVEAAGSLRALGYHPVAPAGLTSPEALSAWHRRCKESIWRHRQKRVVVELHHALADQPALLSGVDAHSPRRLVTVARGIGLPTLAKDQLFAYLCVHGASSGWFRLKWLADLAAVLSPETPAEITRLRKSAHDLGAGRPADLALLLCAELLGTRVDEGMLATLRADRRLRVLAGAARANMSGRSAATELKDVRFGSLWIHLMQFALVPGVAPKLAELRRQWSLRQASARAAGASSVRKGTM